MIPRHFVDVHPVQIMLIQSKMTSCSDAFFLGSLARRYLLAQTEQNGVFRLGMKSTP